jgi:hypothetical protein
MSEKCVNCGLVFRTSNELDWHIRNEHTRRATRRRRVDGEPEQGATGEREQGATGEREQGATGEREPEICKLDQDATGDAPSHRPRWLSAARRLFGRRPPESQSGRGRGTA